MQWLNNIIDSVVKRIPEGEIIVSSGVSPSGKYHLGTLREVLTAEALHLELKRRGRSARHIHIVDDLDVFRKVPAGVPADFSKYLGMPLCDVPSPDGSNKSYADYYLADLFEASEKLHLEMEVIRSHEKYRSGFFVPAIESSLAHADDIKNIITDISGRKLDDGWSPIQVMENGYLKNRKFKSINEKDKTIEYIDSAGVSQSISYISGKVKLNWRIDWPARWWLLNVNIEPFGRDHATKGGSYDTGKAIVKDVFKVEPPYPVPYAFINRSGETKKMSKSAGDTITAAELLNILPAEIVWFFILRYPPEKQLFFDEGEGLMHLFDEFAMIAANPSKSEEDMQLLHLCTFGRNKKTVSKLPFSHLVASYQASLRDADKTLDVLKRDPEYVNIVNEDGAVIKNELEYINNWLDSKAPDEIKFSLSKNTDSAQFSDEERNFLRLLANKISDAPEDADGTWYHNAIYGLADDIQLSPKEMFTVLYRILIGKSYGPRAGWFLSILPRDWLIDRLRFKT